MRPKQTHSIDYDHQNTYCPVYITYDIDLRVFTISVIFHQFFPRFIKARRESLAGDFKCRVPVAKPLCAVCHSEWEQTAIFAIFTLSIAHFCIGNSCKDFPMSTASWGEPPTSTVQQPNHRITVKREPSQCPRVFALRYLLSILCG